ncbi:LysM peptidoglycan-binding domain-containing protein [Alkalihalobacterium elongatum]|uniref:LysM peptidoglycan-binding domain-containing protein n=1 Tax=Alkalihalobacterium elongatum TaxID=2675466 RepID=UPI001C1F23BB|nr:LysM peptidoglycan-binding domain-containing protein [Alkalihalobacterium elongatum]
MSDYKVITKTRKERILAEKQKTTKIKKDKVIRYAFAGALVTSALLNLSSVTEKALARSSDYTVQYGDTLYSLAKKYQLTVDEIIHANDLSSDFIRAGQKLTLPMNANQNAKTTSQTEKTKLQMSENLLSYKVNYGDTLYSIAKKYQLTIQEIKVINNLASNLIKVDQILVIPNRFENTNQQQNATNQVKKHKNTDVGQVNSATYTVVAGDTLWSIAQRFNSSVATLKKNNHLKNDVILIDQQLVIKKEGLIKSSATIVGIVDNISIEILIGDKHKVIQIPYGTANIYDKLIGQEINLIYYHNNRPQLVSIER